MRVMPERVAILEDDPNRITAMQICLADLLPGVDVVFYKVLAFVISGFFAGLAGALYTHYIGLISPSELGPTVTMLSAGMSVAEQTRP